MRIKNILKSFILTYILTGIIAIPMSFGATSSNNNAGASNAPATSKTDSILSNIKSALKNSGTSINTVSRKLDALLISTMEANANLMYQFDTYLSNANDTALHLAPINQLVQTGASNQTHSNIQAKLAEVPFTAATPSTDSSSPYVVLKDLLLKQIGGTTEVTRIKKLANTEGTDTLGFSKTGNHIIKNWVGQSASSTNQQNNFDAAYDFDSLILPQSYKTPSQRKDASNFIMYLSKMYKSSNAIDLSDLKGDTTKLNELKNTPDYRAYLVNNRSNIAATSVPLSNLYQFFSERIKLKRVIKYLEKNGVPVDQSVKDAVDALADQHIYSLLELQNYLANRRVNDATWRKKMLSASPATIQRETLFVLAEMESQLQRLHLDNERFVATLSAAQLQMAQATAGQDIATRNLQSYIDKKYGSESS